MDNLLDWFEDNKIIWVTILAVLAAIEVMVTVIAVYILQKVKKIQKMRWVITSWGAQSVDWVVLCPVINISVSHLTQLSLSARSVRDFTMRIVSNIWYRHSHNIKRKHWEIFLLAKMLNNHCLKKFSILHYFFNSRKSRTVSKRRLYDSSSDGSHSDDNKYLHRI